MRNVHHCAMVSGMADVDLLTTKATADRLGVSVATVARMALDGRLTPALKLEGIRGAMWFRAADVSEHEQAAAS